MALTITVAPTIDLPAPVRRELLTLCSVAYEMEFSPYLEMLGNGLHILGWAEERLVSHAAIITRTLEVDHRIPLHTGYVEAVATLPRAQGQGFATAIMQEVAAQLDAYAIGALSPSDAGFYARLGWEPWRGPLLVRTEQGEEPSPEDEEVMILRCAKTPPLRLDHPLSVEWRPLEIW